MMGNIRIWIAIIIVFLLGAVAFQTVRIKAIKAADKAIQLEEQFKNQKLINDKMIDQLESINTIQSSLIDKYDAAEAQLANIKKTKYIVDANAPITVIQEKINVETSDTIRCNELAGGQKKVDSDKKNSICQELVR